MNLLVTGGTGFIGRCVVEECLQRGWAVTVIVRPGRGESLRPLVAGGGTLRVVEHCAHDSLDLLRSTDFDTLINLVGPGADSWISNWQANVEYVRYLANALRRLSLNHVVHFSSVAVYGTSVRKRGVVIREEDPLAPDDWYGVTKTLGERIWERFHGETEIPVTVLRPSWVIGRGSRLLDKYLLSAVKSGFWVNMLPAVPVNAIYVKDVARAALMAASNEPNGFRMYNINAVDDERMSDLLEALRTEVPGSKIPVYLPAFVVKVLALRFGTFRFLLSGVRVDATKAREELGFVPRYDVRASIRDLVSASAVAGSLSERAR